VSRADLVNHGIVGGGLIMPNTMWRSWLVGGWCLALVGIVGSSVALGASPSTTAMLFVLGVSPAGIMVLIGGNVTSMTVAQILHSVETKDSRR
jgi:hypothetical protein